HERVGADRRERRRSPAPSLLQVDRPRPAERVHRACRTSDTSGSLGMELLKLVATAIISGLSGFAGHVVAHDFCVAAPRICKQIVAAAVRLLPKRDRDRFYEEWMADLDEREGTIAKLRHALGCLYCARSMSRLARRHRIKSVTLVVHDVD